MNINKPVEPVGAWRIGGQGGLFIMVRERPNIFHRFMCELFLGIKWVDKK